MKHALILQEIRGWKNWRCGKVIWNNNSGISIESNKFKPFDFNLFNLLFILIFIGIF